MAAVRRVNYQWGNLRVENNLRGIIDLRMREVKTREGAIEERRRLEAFRGASPTRISRCRGGQRHTATLQSLQIISLNQVIDQLNSNPFLSYRILFTP